LNHTFYILLFFLCPLHIHGQQNLILNGDFEEYWECPDDATQIERCKYVYNPCASVPSTSDYFNACYVPGSSGTPVGIPFTNQGYQFTKSGNGMAGFLCLDATNYQYREYIQLSLSEPTKCGKKYIFEGYFNLSNFYKYSIKNIGFLFSESKINSNDYLYENYTPQYTDSLTLISDTLDWVKLSFEYVADAQYNFLTVGLFLRDSINSYVEVNPNGLAQDYSSYFFVDDFSMREIDDLSLSFPNIITPNGDGINDEFVPTNTFWNYLEGIDIINRWGDKVISLKPPFVWNGLDIKGHKVTNGVYYYVTQSKTECREKKEKVGVIHVIY
jgi:gliding motility-associated-like protein